MLIMYAVAIMTILSSLLSSLIHAANATNDRHAYNI